MSTYSSLIVHHIESETLEKIFKKYGMELNLLNDMEIFDAGIERSVSDTLISIFESGAFEEALEEKDEDGEIMLEEEDIEGLIRKIKKHKVSIDTDTSCYIQSQYDSDEEFEDQTENVRIYETLELNKGKGRFIEDLNYFGDDADDHPELKIGVDVYPIIFGGLSFVVSGKFNGYSQDELEEKIGFAGGYVGKTVTKNTNYLICNDIDNPKSKVLKAKELDVPIISEIEFDKMYADLASEINLSSEYEQLEHDI